MDVNWGWKGYTENGTGLVPGNGDSWRINKNLQIYK
jgi:hypothetical protein